jgi:single-strand DNA-binding protein
MANLNKVFLIGNLTRDPELRYTPNGAAVTELGLALNRYYTTKEGERREEVTFVDVNVWNRQAENCCQYLKKGQPVHIEGYLKMDSWDDKTTGEKRSKMRIEAERVQFLGSRRDDAAGGSSGSLPDDDYAPPPAREAPRRPATESRGPSNGASRNYAPPSNAPPRRPAPPQEAEDDDIPF